MKCPDGHFLASGDVVEIKMLQPVSIRIGIANDPLSPGEIIAMSVRIPIDEVDLLLRSVRK
jgi:hypothetical protein